MNNGWWQIGCGERAACSLLPLAGLGSRHVSARIRQERSLAARFALVHIQPKGRDRLCGLVVIVPGYTPEMYCVPCEALTEYIYVM
jgi:hypothetical protein